MSNVGYKDIQALTVTVAKMVAWFEQNRPSVKTIRLYQHDFDLLMRRQEAAEAQSPVPFTFYDGRVGFQDFEIVRA